MPFAPPKLVLDALVGQGCHGKTCMGDSEPALFLGHNKSGGVDRLPFALAVGHCPYRLDAMPDDQLVNFTHTFIASAFVDFCKWDFTDAGYLKII
jgi:hypothetical protein